jgi:ABC-2 type transport system permease protein
VFGVAFLIGFRPHAGPLDWIAAGGVLLMFILALSWMSAAVGLLAKTPEGASGFTFFVTFLPYASSAFVPVDTMPSWIRGFAENQPVTPVTESIRSLLLNEPAGSAPWLAVAWCGGILVVSVVLSTVLFRRRTT